MKDKEVTAATEAAPAPQDAKRHPEHTIREGDCSASIWTREIMVQGARRVFYSVTLERSYKDRNGQYRYTKSFDLESLPRLVALCQQAQNVIADVQEDQ